MSYDIIFFETNRQDKPVAKFIKSLSDKTVAKVLRTIDLLVEFGPKLGMPHSKKMCPGIYELRTKGTEEIRIFYAFINEKIYLLHGFKKKSQKTPEKELKIVQSRLTLLTYK